MDKSTCVIVSNYMSTVVIHICQCFKWHIYCWNTHLSNCSSWLATVEIYMSLFLMTCLLFKSSIVNVSNDMSTDEIHICQSVSNDMSSVEICICQVFLMTCLLFKSTSSKCFWWHVVTNCLFNFYHLITFILASLITYHKLEKSIQVGI
jgi:hypothetical protein